MKNIIKQIKKAKKIALISHISPDPDTVGSTVAFCEVLKNMGKTVYCFCDDIKINEFELFDSVNLFNQIEIVDENGNALENDFDLFVSIDVATFDRLGKFKACFDLAENTIRIDHHQMSENYAKLNHMVPDSACGIVIFDILKKMKIKITKKIATALYFAIAGDTGIFHYNNTDAKTFLVCSKLMKLGADIRFVYGEYFDKKTVPELKLSSFALLNAKINDDLKYVIMKVSKEDYSKFDAPQTAYVGNLANLYLNCGFKVACIIKEKDDGIRVSLRSKFEYDCSKIAEQLGGGGHKNASGINILSSIDEAEKMVEKEIIKYLNNYEN